MKLFFRSPTARTVVAAAVVAMGLLAPVRLVHGTPQTRVAVVEPQARAATGGEPGRALPFPASHLALRWAGSEDAAVELRWRGEEGVWSPWQPAVVEHDMAEAGGGVSYTTLFGVDRATRVDTRVRSGDASDIDVVAIDTRYGSRRTTPAAVADVAGARGIDPRAAVGQPGVVTRAQWGADESIRGDSPPGFAHVTKLIVHHTADENAAAQDPAATVRAIYHYHVEVRGWSDIGYNFLIDPQGRIYEGRFARRYAAGEIPTGEDVSGRGVIGAHAGGFNTGSVGVALLGHFDEEQPSADALESLSALLAWKADRHDIDVNLSEPYRQANGTVVTTPNLAGHRDTRPTACPGENLYERLPALRREVSRRVAAAHGRTRGYWTAFDDGAVLRFGEARWYGSLRGTRLNGRIIGMAATPAGGGYWLLGSDGGIFAFGAARFHGSTGALRLNKPIVAMAATPSGNGYWLVASDGGIFAFGDARYFGSTGAIRLNQPVVGMAATSTGRGYWLVASDGGIFAFGDARFAGSTGAIRLNEPITAMAARRDGGGYWLVARDGGVFAFNAPFHGSLPASGVRAAPVVSLRATGTSRGYYMLASDGGIFTFGDAKFHGASGAPPAAATDLALLDP